jgi:DNA-binding CsgD family transcriptional regulator
LNETKITSKRMKKQVKFSAKVKKRLPEYNKMVERMAGTGLTKREISKILDLNEDTFNYHYANEYDKGTVILRQKLKKKQISIALSGNVAMLIWLGKQYLDQREKIEESTDYTFRVEEIIVSGNTDKNSLPR